MTNSDKVGYERIGHAAVLTITLPDGRNAIDVDTAEAHYSLQDRHFR